MKVVSMETSILSLYLLTKRVYPHKSQGKVAQYLWDISKRMHKKASKDETGKEYQQLVGYKVDM